MKKKYRLVVFKDINNKKYFITNSTVKTNKTIILNKIKYPLYELEISKYSHPFFIGSKNNKKITGRIEQYNKKYKINL
ncbi:MAG: 50S ribosomal protein L31 [Candidatus Shikimatogenerans bostrichidophilus]|nr:MAG: 50S ribosomal protein L31 [Candidatus Shikimatogenerans bostrichidophilus]